MGLGWAEIAPFLKELKSIASSLKTLVTMLEEKWTEPHCPECDSSDLTTLKRRKVWQCRKCGFTGKIEKFPRVIIKRRG